MQQSFVSTQTSRYIADVIDERMKSLGVKPMEIERKTSGDVHYHTVRRIRKGAAGIALRYYERVLEALNLRLMIVPVVHRDVIDYDAAFKQYIEETKTLKLQTHADISVITDNGSRE